MAAISSAITRILDLFFWSFVGHGPWPGLIAISLVTGVVALLVFRVSSNQRGIRAVKDQIMAHLLEVLLYRDELRVVMRAQARLFVDNLKYLAHALVPLACMIVPVGLLLVQTDLRYGRRPLRPDEQAVVTVKLKAGSSSPIEAALVAPAGIEAETPPVRIPSVGEVSWRVKAVSAGEHELRFSVEGSEFTKRVVVGDSALRIVGRRVSGGVWQPLLHPGEAVLDANQPVEWVAVEYPDAPVRVLGWRLHWVWPFFVLTMAFGYALKKPLRVQF